jgi:hypothetical protein
VIHAQRPAALFLALSGRWFIFIAALGHVRLAGVARLPLRSMNHFDTEIEAAALARFGAMATVDVIRYKDREMGGNGELVTWYALSVDGEVLGRRRTKAELLTMLQNRTAWESTRPVGAIPGASCAIDFPVA